jgi:hypothetical protein
MDPIDTEVLFDLMKQARPTNIAQKDIGCSEFPHAVLIEPMATKDNTGPLYLQPPVTNLRENGVIVTDLFTYSPNPVTGQILINIDHSSNAELSIYILNLRGQIVNSLFNGVLPSGQHIVNGDMSLLPASNYYIIARSQNERTGKLEVQTSKFVKL